MMGLRIFRRSRIALLVFGILFISLYMLLGYLSDEFSREREQSSDMYHPRDVNLDNKIGKDERVIFNSYQGGNIVQPQRKPKTMDLAESDELASPGRKTLPHLLTKIETKVRIKEVNASDYYEDYNEDEIEDENYYEDDEYDEDDDNNDEDGYEYDDEYEYKTNAPFKPGDFGDIRGLEFYKKPKLKYAEVSTDVESGQNKGNNQYKGDSQGKGGSQDKGANQDKGINQLKGVNQNKRDNQDKGDNLNEETEKPAAALVQNGIFWSEYVEYLIPKGLSYVNITNILQRWRRQVVKTLEKPSWDKCGRPQNGYATLRDGSRMCVRYRHPHSTYVYGEALSFYLSRLLQMDNVPAVVLAQTLSTSTQWRAVNISCLNWKENKTIAFIQWIDNINSGSSSNAYIPPLLLKAYRTGVPLTSHVISKSHPYQRNPTNIAELVQWGTMIVFDYLTGNYDRIASMQDAEDKEENPKIMEEPIRNLRKSSSDGKLWLIDNESGLLDAYELLEPYLQKSRFSTFHRQMIETICVFQSSLVNAVMKLSEHPSPHQRLLHFAMSFDPLIASLPKEGHFKLFVKMFDQRLADVVKWIKYCQNLDAG